MAENWSKTELIKTMPRKGPTTGGRRLWGRCLQQSHALFLFKTHIGNITPCHENCRCTVGVLCKE